MSNLLFEIFLFVLHCVTVVLPSLTHQAELQLQRFAALAPEKIVAVGGNTSDVSYELLTSQTTVNNEVNHQENSDSLTGAFVRHTGISRLEHTTHRYVSCLPN